MHDPAVGSAGVAALVLYMAGMIIALSSLHRWNRLLTSIITAEVIAKYAMAFQSYRDCLHGRDLALLLLRYEG